MTRRRECWRLALALLVIGCGDDATAPAVPLGFGPEERLLNRREVEVGFEASDGVVLSGTLLLPLNSTRSYPTIVLHFGSDRWTRATYERSNLRFWIDNEIAVFTYDKRGVGRSQGTCCAWRDPGFFPMLARDVVAAVRMVKSHPGVSGQQIGAWGFSQGGWIVPLAASLAEGDIRWMIVGSGPAVSLGEELLYSALSGDDVCRPSGRSEDEIDRRLTEVGSSGFDPRPVLGALDVPGYWIYGALDTSIPVARSVRVLDSLRLRGRDFTSIVIPRLNHSWIRDGAMCETSGPGGVEGDVIASWLWPRLGRTWPRSASRAATHSARDR